MSPARRHHVLGAFALALIAPLASTVAQQASQPRYPPTRTVDTVPTGASVP